MDWHPSHYLLWHQRVPRESWCNPGERRTGCVPAGTPGQRGIAAGFLMPGSPFRQLLQERGGQGDSVRKHPPLGRKLLERGEKHVLVETK